MVTDTIPIIILNWNGLEDTKECMNSLLCIKNISIEIILADNGSEPTEQRLLIDLYQDHPDITLIINSENRGFAKGNDDIVQQIMNRKEIPEYIALLNNDTVVVQDWMNSLVQTAERYNADIISSKMINYYDRRYIDNLGHFMLNTGEILPYAHREEKEQYDKIIDNVGACGGAVLYRTSMLQEIGFFDLYFITGYEDAELGLRAKLLGYKCILDPNAIVYHKVSRSINKIKNDAYMQHIQTNIFYTFIKLMPMGFLLRNAFFVVVKYMIWLFFGIFTFQFRLIRLHAQTLKIFLSKDLKVALNNRRFFYSQFKEKMPSNMLDSLDVKFFFWTDIRRLLFHIMPR